MKTQPACIAMAVMVASAPVCAQTEADHEALRQLPVAFSQAWAKQDGRALARIMAEDVDFVNVGAVWLHGRRDFETYHTRLLQGRFTGSTNIPLKTSIRFVRPDLATVRWSWAIEGDRDPDGTLRPKRFGLMTMLAEKRTGKWVVVAAQNTNAAAQPPPEAHDIDSPIAMPHPE